MKDDNLMHDCDISNQPHGSLKAYVFGFILSIVLTIIPFYMIANKLLSPMALLYTIFAFAVVQLLIQVYCFLHINQDEKPGWNSISFWFTIVIVLCIVGGSLWIMDHLAYSMGH